MTLEQKIRKVCESIEFMHNLLKVNQVSFLKESEYTAGVRAPSEKEGRHTKLEDTIRSRLEYLLNCDLPEVKIHIGGKEQETLREMGADALTQGKDIYIREESYKEGSEETEKILLHELTHVAQRMEERRIREPEEIAEAEKEASANEQLAEYEKDPYYYAKINGKLFYINNKIAKQAVTNAINRLEEKIRQYIAEENLEMLMKLEQVLGGRL